MSNFIYAGNTYNTIDELNAAVLEMKNKIDNKPTTYCQVKLLSGNSYNGWTIPSDALNDEQILSIDGNGFYSCYSQFDGETHVGLTTAEVKEKIQKYKILYGDYYGVNTIYSRLSPSDPDMSSYVS
jgi:hypothetical protein